MGFLLISKIIGVNVRRVFEAYTLESELSTWFSTNAKIDLKVGGKYSNGDRDEGKYLEIFPQKKLVFTWENRDHCPGTIVEIDFEEIEENKTLVTIQHKDLKSKEDIEHMKEGWEWSLDNLKSYLEIGKIISFEDWKKVNEHIL
jgi:uncharacterized protein YndB with AHSA1/START domain